MLYFNFFRRLQKYILKLCPIFSVDHKNIFSSINCVYNTISVITSTYKFIRVVLDVKRLKTNFIFQKYLYVSINRIFKCTKMRAFFINIPKYMLLSVVSKLKKKNYITFHIFKKSLFMPLKFKFHFDCNSFLYNRKKFPPTLVGEL